MQDFTQDCLQHADAVLTGGPGPFLVSLVPLALALLAAWGLRTGRRAAWILALVSNLAVALLTGTVLGLADPVDPAEMAVLGPEFVIQILLATAVPVVVVVLLLVTRRRFRVAAPRPAAVRFGLTVIGAFVVLAAVYVITGLADGENHLDGPPSLGALLGDVLRPFVPAGFLPSGIWQQRPW